MAMWRDFSKTPSTDEVMELLEWLLADSEDEYRRRRCRDAIRSYYGEALEDEEEVVS